MTLAFQEGQQMRFATAGSLSITDPGTDLTRGIPTDVVFSFNGVLDAGGQQSAKCDLGASRHSQYEVMASIEVGTTGLTSGGTVDFYWAPSTSSTQANGNVMGNSGASGAAADGDTPVNTTVAEFVAACDYIGSLSVGDDQSTVQTGFVGVFSPSSRYGQLVAVNNTGATTVASDAEHHVVFNPIVVVDV